MNSQWTAMLFGAAWLIASVGHGLAESDPQPMPEAHVAGFKHSSTHRRDKTRTKQNAAPRPATKASQPDPEQIDAAERAESLERRRKAFFASKPAKGEPAGDASTAPVGVTLGGSGGLTPEMGLKF